MRRRWWRWAIALTAAAAAALWLSVQDPGSLLAKSTRVASVHGWGLDRPNLDVPLRFYELMPGGAQYQWAGNRQILFFHGLAPIQATVRGAGGRSTFHLDWPASIGTPTLYDVDAHRELALPTVARWFRDSSGRAQTAFVSPDGRRLLWVDAKDCLHIALLDGSRQQIVATDRPVSARWTSDGRSLYTYSSSEDDRQRNVIAVDLWNIETSRHQADFTFAQPPGYDLLGGCALLPDGMLTTNTLRQPRIRFGLMLHRITPAPRSRVETYSPVLPSGTWLESGVYSPKGDRLALVIDRVVAPSWAPLRRWLPVRYTPQRTASLWVIESTGLNLREIGHISAPLGRRQSYLIDYVRWQPDGKTLSFVSDDTLYTVPAN